MSGHGERCYRFTRSDDLHSLIRVCAIHANEALREAVYNVSERLNTGSCPGRTLILFVGECSEGCERQRAQNQNTKSLRSPYSYCLYFVSLNVDRIPHAAQERRAPKRCGGGWVGAATLCCPAWVGGAKVVGWGCQCAAIALCRVIMHGWRFGSSC